MKKFIIVVAILLVSVFLYVFIVNLHHTEKHILQLSGVNYYDPEAYPIPLTIFPASIPSSADVLSYTYYNYWHEAEDIYLELKFNNVKDMENYLFDVKRTCLENCQNYIPINNCEWFIETKNIYNEKYNEIFCSLYVTSQGEEDYTGYAVTGKPEGSLFKCNFGAISYSFEELIVIHTYVYGWYQKNVHNYTPKYFTRFNIPIQENHQRIFSLTRGQWDSSGVPSQEPKRNKP